jgi:hypothetical protein
MRLLLILALWAVYAQALCEKGNTGDVPTLVALPIGDPHCSAGGVNITSGLVTLPLCALPHVVRSIITGSAIGLTHNTYPILPGREILFPLTTSTQGTKIVRNTPASFNLTVAGVYRYDFQVQVDQAGQIAVELDAGGGYVPQFYYPSAGNATITGHGTVTTTVANTVFHLKNPLDNTKSLYISGLVGGAFPAAAHLTLEAIE